MAKDLKAPYEPGGRGKRWLKLKVAETVDCVIIAADRGSGRRVCCAEHNAICLVGKPAGHALLPHNGMPLVSRFRRSHHFAARSRASVGSKGTLATLRF